MLSFIRVGVMYGRMYIAYFIYMKSSFMFEYIYIYTVYQGLCEGECACVSFSVYT